MQSQCTKDLKKMENEAGNLAALLPGALNHNLAKWNIADRSILGMMVLIKAWFQEEVTSPSPWNGETRRVIHLICCFLSSIFLGQDSLHRC